jgi:hypothetical protein
MINSLSYIVKKRVCKILKNKFNISRNNDITGLVYHDVILLDFVDRLISKEHLFWIELNPNLTMEYINKNNYNRNWDWDLISKNSNITMDMIVSNMDKPWVWESVSDNPNITIEFILSHMDKKLCWSSISYNSNITPNDVQNYPRLPWDWYWLSKNPNITLNFIEFYIDKPWDWSYLSSNSIITMEFVEKYIDKPWDLSLLCQNENLNIKMIKKNSHINKIWEWILRNDNISRNVIIYLMNNINKLNESEKMKLFMNKYVPIQFIDEYLSKNRYDRIYNYFKYISKNPNITMEFIDKYSEYIEWDLVSQNPNININIIESNIDRQWEWDFISRNPNITIDFIKKYPNKPWDWFFISLNKNLRLEDIEKNNDKPWNWFSNNIINKIYEREYNNIYRRYSIINYRYQKRKKIDIGM